MDLKEKALYVCDALEKEYPLAECTLTYEEAWQLMISVRLAAQCTDARVDIVTAELFKKYPSPKAVAEADYEDLLALIRPCGLGATKTRDVQASMRKLVDEYDSIVPDDLDTLLTFPGVGRKSANLIVGDIYGKPAIVCDTHCIRISNLLGLTGSKNPEKVERDLRAIVPPKRGNDLCHRFVLHGRACCVARRPDCERCCLKEVCNHYSETCVQ